MSHSLRIQNQLSVIPFPHWEWEPCIPQELVWFLIHTHYRVIPVKWEFIYIKDIFHMCYEFGISFLGDAPVSVPVWSDFVFFNVRRIVSRLTGSSRTIFISFSRSLMVQRLCPSGAGLHATSMTLASDLPFILRRALSDFMLRFRAVR